MIVDNFAIGIAGISTLMLFFIWLDTNSAQGEKTIRFSCFLIGVLVMCILFAFLNHIRFI